MDDLLPSQKFSLCILLKYPALHAKQRGLPIPAINPAGQLSLLNTKYNR